MAAGVQPSVDGDRALDGAQALDRVAQEQSRFEEAVRGRFGCVLPRSDQELVGRAAGRRGEHDGISAQCDLEALLAEYLADAAAALPESR